MMNRSSKKSAAAVLAAALLVAPAVWFARAEPGQGQGRAQPARATQSPAVQRPDNKGNKPDTNPTRRPQAPGAQRPGMRPIDQPVSPAEWIDISEFMAQYMPWRINAVQQMPEGLAKERVKRLLGARYRGLRAIQNRDPESFEARLGQLKIEDQIYKLVSELGSGGADPQRRQQIQDQLRPEVANLVDVDLSERQRRVDRLEDELRRQKKLLEQDTRERDNIIERRLGRFLDWGTHWPKQRGSANGPVAKPDAGGDSAPGPAAGRPSQQRPQGDDAGGTPPPEPSPGK